MNILMKRVKLLLKNITIKLWVDVIFTQPIKFILGLKLLITLIKY